MNKIELRENRIELINYLYQFDIGLNKENVDLFMMML